MVCKHFETKIFDLFRYSLIRIPLTIQRNCSTLTPLLLMLTQTVDERLPRLSVLR